jgi:hypothetical protein
MLKQFVKNFYCKREKISMYSRMKYDVGIIDGHPFRAALGAYRVSLYVSRDFSSLSHKVRQTKENKTRREAK